jgi:hypothetical protein
MIGNPALQQTNVNGVSFFQKFIPALVNFALIVGSLYFLANIVAGAIQWISSGGDKASLEAARSRITNSVVGIVILFAIYAVLNLIAAFFNIRILTLDIAPLVIR